MRPVLVLPRNASQARLLPKAGIVPAHLSQGEQQHQSSSVDPEVAGQVFKDMLRHLGNIERSCKEEKYVKDLLCKEPLHTSPLKSPVGFKKTLTLPFFIFS